LGRPTRPVARPHTDRHVETGVAPQTRFALAFPEAIDEPGVQRRRRPSDRVPRVSAAPEGARTVDDANAIANGSVAPYYLDDRKIRVAIARVDDRLYAFDDLYTCTNERCPLSGGLLTDTTVMCQCHGSRFDISTAAVTAGPADKPRLCTPCKKSTTRSRSTCDVVSNLLPAREQMAFTQRNLETMRVAAAQQDLAS
jgi:3-phenylpropionate/trans-cinnamate dioxygenase ferredoxin subunit